MMFGEDTFIMLKFKLKGEDYTIEEIVKIIDEVESLREENVKLSKDRSALHDINEGLQQKVDILQKQVRNYQDVIANNTTSIRCKELEGVIKELDEVLAQYECSNKVMHQNIDGLRQEILSLENSYAELLGLFHGKLDEVKEQQAIIECQKNDIERLVKLNSRLISKQEDLKGAFYSILNR